MLELVKLPGIGAIRAKKLWEAGIHTITDVTTETSKLLDIFDSKFTRKLQSDAEALLRENK
jgi:predicted RecB family nuclease